MKIYSWNINGIRAILKKPEFGDFLKQEKPDILLLQEIKISEDARRKKGIDFEKYGYSAFWNSAEQAGYSGTLTLVKNSSLGSSASEWDYLGAELPNGIGIEKFDKEGRVQILELPDFFVVNAYFPNSNHELTRLGYKTEFNHALGEYIKKLDRKKPVVIGGDFNVAHEETDLARPQNNKGKAGFTKDERKWLHKFLEADFADTFRVLNPNRIQYSWWTYRALARQRNVGWRIDYFIVSQRLLPKIKSAQIHDQIMGSDHCPVSIEI